MTQKPVVPRALAGQDIQDAVDYYLSQSAPEAAMVFVDALEKVFLKISRHPALGSPRYAHELELPGLRYWQLPRFPYLVFYLEHEDHIDVWRVLHGQRDIPVSMQNSE